MVSMYHPGPSGFNMLQRLKVLPSDGLRSGKTQLNIWPTYFLSRAKISYLESMLSMLVLKIKGKGHISDNLLATDLQKKRRVNFRK